MLPVCCEDTSGLEDFMSILPVYLRGVNITVVGFSVASRASFCDCHRWIDSAREEIETSSSSIMVVVGSQIDIEDRREISTKEARTHFEATYRPPIPYFEVSAKTGEGVNEFFESIVKLAINKYDSYVGNNNQENTSKPQGKNHNGCIIC